MKKLLLGILSAAVCVSPLFALRPGDKALKLDKVRAIRGKVLELSPLGSDTPQPELRAAVFLLCRAVNSGSTAAMLNDLERKYAGKLQIAIVTPDPTVDAEEFKVATADFPVALAVDVERKLTKEYMAGSLLYPMAFLVNRDGVIVWCGEAVDLAEKIQPALDGKLSIGTEAKIAELVAELQQLLRDNSDTSMRKVTSKIFDLEPGNAAAMRIRLFHLENTGRIPEARKLIDEQLKAAPKLVRLYFTAVDFAARYGYSDAELNVIVAAFERNISDPAVRVRMAWMLLERFPYHPSALRAAAATLRRKLPADPVPRANAAAARALLEYRLGNVDEALKYQRETVRLLNQVGTETELNSAKRREAYFRVVSELK
jgi:tetratricopeptide (TPR) repeat protein